MLGVRLVYQCEPLPFVLCFTFSKCFVLTEESKGKEGTALKSEIPSNPDTAMS